MRFYNLDGIEEDVQDHRFFIDENELIEIQESIEEILGMI